LVGLWGGEVTSFALLSGDSPAAAAYRQGHATPE
jgi:hypothetical protein